MPDAADLAGMAAVAFEDEHVARARRLRLNEIRFAVDGHHAEDGFIEAE